MSTSSPIINSHERGMFLESLPEDLLVEISSCVAASSLSDVRTLRLVSKSFSHICDERYVINRLSLQEVPLFPWSHNRERFSKFLKRCCMNGNPEALYRKGFINYFLLDNPRQRNRQRRQGRRLLAEAVEKGNQEAKYVYGLILICRGGKTKQKGFKILSSVIKPLMSKTMEELVELRYKIRDNVLWRGKHTMRKLKRAYVREKCECDGETKRFLVNNSAWDRYGEDNDMNTSSACAFCLWHHELELFFDKID